MSLKKTKYGPNCFQSRHVPSAKGNCASVCSDSGWLILSKKDYYNESEEGTDNKLKKNATLAHHPWLI